jgi:ABC-2 type transport system ATP-binding protein
MSVSLLKWGIDSRERLGSRVVSNAVEVNSLGVTFGDLVAVNDVTVHADYGDVVTLLGPNGAGKTTVVETLLGFRRPTSGSVRLGGRTGALLQRGGVWFPMSPAQVLRLTATYYHAPRVPEELLTLLDLTHCARTPWRRLSGGEQQRTLLALALIGRPRILLLDEPTTAVDPEGRQVIRELVRSERNRGCAILITTHELGEAEQLADRIVIMNKGHVVVQGTLDDLAGSPEIIIETSASADPIGLASVLGCEVTRDGPLRLRCAAASTPERIALITTYLTGAGLAMTSLRTRATLEERYLELIASERDGATT